MTDIIVKTQAVRLAGQRLRRRSTVERHPTQDRFDAHAQLGHAEGFWQVVIGAQTKAADAILLGTQCRHQHHGRGMALA